MRIQDDQVRRRALDISESQIVQAPAGSGKTELLIQRFLKLLAVVERPEQILAMTFTRKAAAEMRTRLLKSLERANQPSPANPHEVLTWNLARAALERNQERNWRLLDNPHRLKIQTIDGFCAALTRQTPLISGAGATLEIQENVQELYIETARRLIRQVEQDTPVGRAVGILLQRLDNDKGRLQERIVNLLEKRDQWMISFSSREEMDAGASREEQESRLRGLIDSILIEARAEIPENLQTDLVPLARYAGDNRHSEDPEDPLAALRDLTGFPEPESGQLHFWRALAHLLLTGKGKQTTLRKPRGMTIRQGFPPNDPEGMKNRIKDLLNSPELPGLVEILHEVRELPNPEFSEAEWEFMEAMLYLLPEIADLLRQVFRETGKTDFPEIALAARAALGHPLNPTDLLLKLDMKLQHILVDEFQDTSFKQIELLKLLTEGWVDGDGRTLFIVGDPMQSIYKFRDALVGLFIQVRDHGLGEAAPIKLHYLQLQTNFRSQKRVVDWFNRCFSHILPPQDDPDRGAIAFSKSVASQAESDLPGVCYHPVGDSGGEDEAQRVVAIIETIRKRDPKASVAILVRARTHIETIVTRLQQARIPIRSEAIDPLTGRPEILDLLALLRALLSRGDRIAWLSILRAPWCGLGLADLLALCRNHKQGSLWPLFNSPEVLAGLSEDGRERVQRITGILSRALSALPWAEFRDVLEGTWLALGGPACVSASASGDIRLFFDKVSEVADAEGPAGLLVFDQVLQKLYSSPTSSRADAVQLMTMHKAKGLEFDYVLLPALNKQPKNEDNPLIYWMPHGDKLLLAPIAETGGEASPIFKFLRRLNDCKERFEAQRLLYVATTRARRQLHLLGSVPIRDSGDPKLARNSLMVHLWPFVEADWQAAVETGQAPEAGTAPEAQLPPFLRRLPSGFMAPAPPAALDTGTAEEISEVTERPVFEWAGNQARCLGNVLHRCFREMTQDTDWGIERWQGMADRLKTALRAEGLSPREIEAAHARGLMALKNTLDDDTGRWILQGHSEAHSEFAQTYHEKNMFRNRVIDRTFVDEDNVRWIIDYKTGEHLGGDLDRFFEQEKRRHKPQLDEYEKMLRLGGETRAIRKALYYPLHKRLLHLTD